MTKISPIEDILADAAAGKPFVLVDDENRENEGDIIIPASAVTPEIINFMATEGRGLICLAMTQKYADKLDLPLMPRRNCGSDGTAFTWSIDARWGIETGISATDRAHTIQQVLREETGPQDFIVPGHVFPLISKADGVLEREGHTEASVDVSVLAGLPPVAVICEIVNEDGTMARLPDLEEFCRTHSLKLGTIESLVAYRKGQPEVKAAVA